MSLIPPGQSLREIRLQFKQQILVLSKEGIDVRLPDLLPQKLVGGALIQKDRLYMGDGGAEDRDDAVERSVTENADACLSGFAELIISSVKEISNSEKLLNLRGKSCVFIE